MSQFIIYSNINPFLLQANTLIFYVLYDESILLNLLFIFPIMHNLICSAFL